MTTIAGQHQHAEQVQLKDKKLKTILLTESELKRQLSHDLANDPALSTVFNPPQIFSDLDHVHDDVIMWNNHDNIVSIINFLWLYVGEEKLGSIPRAPNEVKSLKLQAISGQ
jgi:hypothetical protein